VTIEILEDSLGFLIVTFGFALDHQSSLLQISKFRRGQQILPEISNTQDKNERNQRPKRMSGRKTASSETRVPVLNGAKALPMQAMLNELGRGMLPVIIVGSCSAFFFLYYRVRRGCFFCGEEWICDRNCQAS